MAGIYRTLARQEHWSSGRYYFINFQMFYNDFDIHFIDIYWFWLLFKQFLSCFDTFWSLVLFFIDFNYFWFILIKGFLNYFTTEIDSQLKNFHLSLSFLYMKFFSCIFCRGQIKIWDTTQIWLVSIKIVFNVSIFKFLVDLRRGSKSSKSDSVLPNNLLRIIKYLFCKFVENLGTFFKHNFSKNPLVSSYCDHHCSAGSWQYSFIFLVKNKVGFILRYIIWF